MYVAHPVQAASIDDKAIEELWQKLHDEAVEAFPNEPLGANPESHYDLLGMSSRLLGGTDARCLFATHRALCKDRTFFFRLKTRPPSYHPRDADEVARVKKQRQHVRNTCCVHSNVSVPSAASVAQPQAQCACITRCLVMLARLCHRPARLTSPAPASQARFPFRNESWQLSGSDSRPS
jgi:hypothetical protein